jgi:hypothetical protein
MLSRGHSKEEAAQAAQLVREMLTPGLVVKKKEQKQEEPSPAMLAPAVAPPVNLPLDLAAYFAAKAEPVPAPIAAPVQLAPSEPQILYLRENMSPRRVRVFTGCDEDYVYPGSIFAKQRKSVEQRQWTGYGTPARKSYAPR